VAPGLGINNSGEVVLSSYFYSHGMLTAFPAGFRGEAINASGHVSGFYMGGTAIYYDGTVTPLPDPPDGYPIANYAAPAINDSDAVLINYAINFIQTFTDLYSNGTLTSIANGCTAQAINDSAVITGTCGSYLFIADATANSAQTNLGIRGGANAINASDEVTGSETSPSTGAFLWSHGKVTVLPNTANCAGNGINTSGFVVGTCPGTAFFYNSTTSDLNDRVSSSDPLKPYVTLTDARGINDNGLLIVNGTDSRDHLGHAYLMQLQLI
jgi:hypothetical protein